MAFNQFSCMASFFWLCLLSSNLVSSRNLPKHHQGMEARQQNTSVSFGNSSKPTICTMSELAHRCFLEGKDPYEIFHEATMKNIQMYYGVQARIYVYGLPTVKSNQLSSAQVWVEGFNSNSIEAGWHVAPDLYGNSDTHFFISWTSDGYKNTGCYNFQCEGFVHVNSSLINPRPLIPGQRIRPLSQYNRDIYAITVKISKDPQTGDWWLHSGPNGDRPIGYWPITLFNGLNDSPPISIRIGGAVYYNKGDVGPPMGSGHDALEGEHKAAAVRDWRLVNENGDIFIPDSEDFTYCIDKRECYYMGGGDYPEEIYFGGPEGCDDY